MARKLRPIRAFLSREVNQGNRLMRTVCTVLLAAVLFTAVPAIGDVIYDNGYDNSFGTATASDFDLPHHLAESFVLQPGATTVTDIHWWGVHLFGGTPPATDNFTVRIFEDSGGMPVVGALHEYTNVSGNRVASGNTIFGRVEYAYSLDIAPVVLSANTMYWLSIVNDTTNDTNDDWYWSAIDNGQSARRTDDSLAWSAYPYEHAFYLTGPGTVIPEPASMTLLGLGLASAAVGMRKQRSAV